MNNHNTGNAFGEAQPKDNELTAVYRYLHSTPATATQVATALNIYRPNLCRRKRSLEKIDRLRQIRKVVCPVTKHKAWQLTCDPALFPAQSQLSLFSAEGKDHE